MKKTLVALAAVAYFGMSSSVMAAAGEGVVKFHGTVVEAPCGIAPESADQTIDFGQLSRAHLENDGISMKKNVDIKLVNCVIDNKTNNMVSVTFNGAVVDNTADKELGTAGNTGTAIVMSGPNGPVLFGTKNKSQKFGANSNTLRYSAWVKKATGATVTEGSFSAVSNFTMEYQ
ncbi:F7-2 fimbrial protein [Vibrio agarivorans]|nr:F7-2 fimbrial protein [Vibrio agarivorans]